MSFAKSKTTGLRENLVFSYLKGLIISMLISFALIIFLAVALKWFSIGESMIYPLNLLIKAISVLVGSCIAIKGKSKGLIKGVAFGFLYILSAFSCFSILANSFIFDLNLFLDLFSACVVGGIVGIIKVNK